MHSIGDAAGRQWTQKLSEFLQLLRRRNIRISSVAELDICLAEHFDWLCYGERRQPTAGTVLFFGLLYLMPELKDKLKLAVRSLKSWQRLSISVEGAPACEEAVLVVALWLLSHDEEEAGFWVLVQYDVYGREQDLEMLKTHDVVWDPSRREVALMLGVAERDEEVKIGTNQGVVVERGIVGDILLGLKESAPRGQIFEIGQAHLRKAWHKAARAKGTPSMGPPHILRHTAASEGLARKKMSLENTRRRGR